MKQEDTDMVEKDSNIVLNATSEFCRALGEIPTYGQSGNRDEIEKDELMVRLILWRLLSCSLFISSRIVTTQACLLKSIICALALPTI